MFCIAGDYAKQNTNQFLKSKGENKSFVSKKLHQQKPG
jgi:hypothetical protein